MKPTRYEDINKILTHLSSSIKTILGENLIGLYLTGSLSYDGFNPGRSDIDLEAVLNHPATESETTKLREMHEEVAKTYPTWAKRVECSYTPLEMFRHISPPKEPRLYLGVGVLKPAQYGNEWVINNYFLYKYGVTLIGPEFKTFVRPIDIKDVQEACIKDLFKEWEPKIRDEIWLHNSHYQSYVVLNICRILYTVMNADVASKNVSATWIKKEFPQWKNLIETAKKWEYGEKMKLQKETAEFIHFAIDFVNKRKQILQ